MADNPCCRRSNLEDGRQGTPDIFSLTWHCPAILPLSLHLFSIRRFFVFLLFSNHSFTCYIMSSYFVLSPTLSIPLHPIHSYKVIMEVYVQRTHGTYIEQKGNELIWQFRSVKCSFRDVAPTVLARTRPLLIFMWTCIVAIL